jgi:two-component system, NarL family, invasion response regulator UvrY
MLARASPWDVALVDLNLPDGHGVEALLQLQRVIPGLAMLILSLHNESAYARQALRLGARGYLTKEHAADELLQAVERLLAGGRYISAALAEQLAQGLAGNDGRPAHEQLGRQEYRVLLQLAAGRKVGEIAQAMHLSPKTVSTYRSRILDKLELGSNVELASYCQHHGLKGDAL